MSSYPPGRIFHFPTKWTVKQSFLWADMSIMDEWGNEVFKAETKVFSLSDELQFFDKRNGQGLAELDKNLLSSIIDTKWFSVGPTTLASISRMVASTLDDRVMAKKKFTLIKPEFSIETTQHAGSPISITGNWHEHDYVFHRDNVPIATVHKKFLTMRDTYIVEIQPNVDVMFILACCVVIDKCMTAN